MNAVSESALPPPVVSSWLGRAREIGSDLIIATALIWALPLLLGAAAAVFDLLL